MAKVEFVAGDSASQTGKLAFPAQVQGNGSSTDAGGSGRGGNRFFVKVEELLAAMGQLEAANGNVRIALLRMTDAVLALDAGWNGADSEQLIAHYNELSSKLMTRTESVERAISYLRNAVMQIFVAKETAIQLASSIDVTYPFTD